MNSKIMKSLIAGVIGTAVLTLFGYLAPYIGLPESSVAHKLSGMLGVSLTMGWIIHFMNGIIFALAYNYFIADHLKIKNLYVKGVVFGVGLFVFAQVMMVIMVKMLGINMPNMTVMSIIGGVIGHILYTTIVVKMIGK